MGRRRLLQRRRPAQLGGGALRPLNVYDADGVLPWKCLLNPGGGPRPLRQKVRAHMGGIEILVLHIRHAVHQDDGDFRLPGLLEHGVPAALADGHEDNIIHLLLNEFADSGNLVLLLLPGILKEKAVSVLLGEDRLHGLRVGYPPVGLRTHLAHANHRQVLVGRIHAGNRPGPAGGGKSKDQQRHPEKPFHVSSFSRRGTRTVTVVPTPSRLERVRP